MRLIVIWTSVWFPHHRFSLKGVTIKILSGHCNMEIRKDVLTETWLFYLLYINRSPFNHFHFNYHLPVHSKTNLQSLKLGISKIICRILRISCPEFYCGSCGDIQLNFHIFVITAPRKQNFKYTLNKELPCLYMPRL